MARGKLLVGFLGADRQEFLREEITHYSETLGFHSSKSP